MTIQYVTQRCHQYSPYYHIPECVMGNVPGLCDEQDGLYQGDNPCNCILQEGVEYQPEDYIKKD